MNKSKALQDRLEQLHADLATIKERTKSIDLLDAKASCCTAEILACTSQLAEITTGRIVRLTWALCFLTFGLLVVTVFVYKDSHALVKSSTEAQHRQAQQP